MHPMYAFSNKEKSYCNLKNSYFTLEGDKRAIETLSNLLIESEIKYKVLGYYTKENKEDCLYFKKENNLKIDKTLYHLASVFSSNLILALLDISIDLLNTYGIYEDEAKELLYKLVFNNLKTAFNRPIKDALSGPVERCDIKTIEKHIDALGKLNIEKKESIENIILIYKGLSQVLVEIEKTKNSSKNKDYCKIEELLKV